jgi:hypothetical protein
VAKTRSTSESAKRGKIVTLSQGSTPYRHVSSLVNAVAFKHLVAFKRAFFVEIVTSDYLGMLLVLCCITLWVRYQIRNADYLEINFSSIANIFLSMDTALRIQDFSSCTLQFQSCIFYQNFRVRFNDYTRNAKIVQLF